MQWSDVVAQPTNRALREFAACGAVLLCGWAGWQALQGRSWIVGTAGLGCALLLGLVAYRMPRLLSPLYRVWMAGIFPLAWLMSTLLLAVLFFGMITPLALLFRLVRRDALGQKIDSTTDSYWQSRPPSPNSRRYFRQY